MKARFRKSIQAQNSSGFSLIITISLMVLLSLVAVGLLSLSSTVLRASGAELDERIARANARLALQMAIGQLQKFAGEDRRITMAADQISDDGAGSQPSASIGFRHWTGVYEAWDDELELRPEPNHLTWLVSNPSQGGLAENAPVSGASLGQSVTIVGNGTAGPNPNLHVNAPLMMIGQNEGGLAWWTGDQGLKAALALPPAQSANGLAEIRREQQSVSSLPLAHL